jgi:hypothetical protein
LYEFFYAHLVACGYSQVPGIDFQESFAPVIYDVTFHIQLIMILTLNLKGKIKELLRVVKFVLVTKDDCLKLNPICEDEEWDLMLYSDSNWDGNPETRINMTGFIIYLLGAPICWRSKGQKGVILSSSEAEYVSMLEVVKEIRFYLFSFERNGI